MTNPLAQKVPPQLEIPGGWGTETILLRHNPAAHVNHTLQIWCPADADAVIDQQIQAGNDQDPFWCYLWPTSRALAQQVFEVMQQPSTQASASNLEAAPPVPSLRVLETGCGIGLVGLAALAAGATTVTFQDLRSPSVELALHNARVNGFGDRALGDTFDWRSPPDQQFDWILASDILYHPPAHEDLLNFLEGAIRHQNQPPNAPTPPLQHGDSPKPPPLDRASTLPHPLQGTIWIGDPGRREAEAFIQQAQTQFQVTIWTADGKPLASPQHGQYQLIVLQPHTP